MKVFKFGGASVKNADAVKNVASIIKRYPDDKLVVVISAMGKTTNLLEQVVEAYYNKSSAINEHIDRLESQHLEIINGLFADKKNVVFSEFHKLIGDLKEYVKKEPDKNYDLEYDQIICKGELLSSMILSNYLNSTGIKNQWFDARTLIFTDNNYRDAGVNWQKTSDSINSEFNAYFRNASDKIAITQGFIGSTSDGKSVSLGREGSDYTAAIIAHSLNAEDVTIWKDVPGLLNADPKYFDDTKKIECISYKETIELSYYGATIIHPKTIKPLENKNIPLKVKSFFAPDEKGSVICNETKYDSLLPLFIFKVNQILISISPKDFSFIVEENLSSIFSCFARYGVNIHLMQNSAINFSVCCDNNKLKITQLINALREKYRVKYNDNLELITIRHYDQQTIDRVLISKQILLEQKSRSTIKILVKPKDS